MSNLSDLLPAGGGLTAEFVASGTLPNGQAVILNSTGTVTAVAGSGSGAAVPANSVSRFDVGATQFPTSHYDGSTGRFVVVFADGSNSYYGTACVGTVTGTSIVFSSLYIWRSADCRNVKFAIDPNTAGKMIIVFSQDFGTLSGVVGTYTGTGASASMSFGSDAVLLNLDIPGDLAITYDKNTANRFVIMAHSPTNQGKGIVGNISGTTVTMGTAVEWASGSSAPYPRGVDYIAYDETADKFVTAFADAANSNYLNAIVGTISGTNTLSFGTRTASTLVTDARPSIAVDPLRSGSFLIAYVDQPTSYIGRALVASLSGTTVSFGTPVAFNAGSGGSAGNTNRPQVFMGSGTQDKGGVTCKRGTNPYTIQIVSFTISGTSVSFGTTYDLVTGTNPENITSAFNPAQAGQFTTSYGQSTSPAGGDVGMGQLLVGSQQATNLTTTNFVGMPDAAYSSGATATVALQGGISLNQTSLTIGTTYYVQDNGSLGTSAGTVNVEAGRAISATSLLLKGI